MCIPVPLYPRMQRGQKFSTFRILIHRAFIILLFFRLPYAPKRTWSHCARAVNSFVDGRLGMQDPWDGCQARGHADQYGSSEILFINVVEQALHRGTITSHTHNVREQPGGSMKGPEPKASPAHTLPNQWPCTPPSQPNAMQLIMKAANQLKHPMHWWSLTPSPQRVEKSAVNGERTPPLTGFW